MAPRQVPVSASFSVWRPWVVRQEVVREIPSVLQMEEILCVGSSRSARAMRRLSSLSTFGRPPCRPRARAAAFVLGAAAILAWLPAVNRERA